MVLSFSYQCRNGTHQQSRGSPVKFFLEPNYPSDLGLWLIHDTLPPSDRQNRIAARDRAMEAEFRLELNFLQLLAVLHWPGVNLGVTNQKP